MGFEDYKQTHSACAATALSGSEQTFTPATRGIYVGGDGNLVCRLASDSDDTTFTGLVAGTVYPFAVSIVRATSTITNSIALF